VIHVFRFQPLQIASRVFRLPRLDRVAARALNWWGDNVVKHSHGVFLFKNLPGFEGFERARVDYGVAGVVKGFLMKCFMASALSLPSNVSADCQAVASLHQAFGAVVSVWA
jgi:hypothetical protein